MPVYHIIKSEEVRTEYFIEAKDEAHAKRKALKGREKFIVRAKIRPSVVYIDCADNTKRKRSRSLA